MEIRVLIIVAIVHVQVLVIKVALHIVVEDVLMDVIRVVKAHVSGTVQMYV